MRRLGLYPGRLPGFDKRGFDRHELMECVVAADACGYDSFWMPEVWERDAFSILTELGVRTMRIGLATGIINVFSRSPGLIAMSAATLDELSGGRFRLGLGTSGARVVEDFHGVSYQKPLTRLKETIQIVRALLRGERLDFEGDCFKLHRFKLGFKPLRSELPIYVAALTPRSLRQLGALADGWLPTHWPRESLADGISEITAGALEAGREDPQIVAAPFVNVVVSNDLSHARDLARLPLAYYVGGMGEYYHATLQRTGFAAQADLIQKLWKSGRRRDATKAVSDEMVDAIAICGPIERCRALLDEMYVAGAGLPIVAIPGEGTIANKCRIIESLVAT